MGLPSLPPQQPQDPLPSIMSEQQLAFLSAAFDSPSILAQHGQEDIDMPSFILWLGVSAIVVVQADRAITANIARSGRNARDIDTVI